MLAKTIADAVLHATDEDAHDVLHRILTDFYGKPLSDIPYQEGLMSYA